MGLSSPIPVLSPVMTAPLSSAIGRVLLARWATHFSVPASLVHAVLCFLSRCSREFGLELCVKYPAKMLYLRTHSEAKP